MQITINIDEASGRITVEAEGQKPYECSSPDECLEYLGDMLKGEEPAEQQRQYIRDASWITLIPGLALAVTVLSLNLLGDGLRDVLDPRLKVAQD